MFLSLGFSPLPANLICVPSLTPEGNFIFSLWPSASIVFSKPLIESSKSIDNKYRTFLPFLLVLNPLKPNTCSNMSKGSLKLVSPLVEFVVYVHVNGPEEPPEP